MPNVLQSSGPLDTPPPSPSVPGGGAGGPQAGPGGGAGQMPTLGGLSQPAPVSSAQMPPEILTGILAAAQKIDGIFDSFAQVSPDLAMDWDLCKQVLQRALGKLLVAGGGATSSTNTGSQFPAGGLNQGMNVAA